ncbi:MAG: hypothetical protein ACRCY9_14040 [Phycicoccus sp.]
MSAQEVAGLVREAADLIDRGTSASQQDWQAYHDRKLDLLDRIAGDPGPFTDPDEAAYVKQVARSQAEAMRMGARPLIGDL